MRMKPTYILGLGMSSWDLQPYLLLVEAEFFSTLIVLALPPTASLPTSGLWSTGNFSSQLPQYQDRFKLDSQLIAYCSPGVKQQSQHLPWVQPFAYSDTVITALAFIQLAVFCVHISTTQHCGAYHWCHSTTPWGPDSQERQKCTVPHSWCVSDTAKRI